MKMQKKGQATVMFLLGAIILFAFTMSYFFGERAPEVNTATADFKAQPVSNFIETCLSNQVRSGLSFLGLQGGYNKPANAQEYLTLSVPLYLDNSELFVPTIDIIQNELAFYIKENLAYCVDNFEILEGYQITTGPEDTIVANVVIGAEDVRVALQYPIEVKRGEDTITIEEFSATVPFHFNDVFSIIQDIMAEQEKDLLAVHFGYLAESAYNNDYFFEIIQLDDNTVIYSITFESLILNNEPYLFNFAANYDW